MDEIHREVLVKKEVGGKFRGRVVVTKKLNSTESYPEQHLCSDIRTTYEEALEDANQLLADIIPRGRPISP